MHSSIPNKFNMHYDLDLLRSSCIYWNFFQTKLIWIRTSENHPSPTFNHDFQMCIGVSTSFICCLSCTHLWLSHQNNSATNTFLTPTRVVSVNQQNMKPIICEAGSSLFKRSLRNDFLWACSCCIKHTKKLFKVMSLASAVLLFSVSWQFLYSRPCKKCQKMKMHFTDEMTAHQETQHEGGATLVSLGLKSTLLCTA